MHTHPISPYIHILTCPALIFFNAVPPNLASPLSPSLPILSWAFGFLVPLSSTPSSTHLEPFRFDRQSNATGTPPIQNPLHQPVPLSLDLTHDLNIRSPLQLTKAAPWSDTSLFCL
ncbi:hypothetical protein MANI_022206 [Metarhizium anisopliae]|nr:hypothetical protein MANI_022206 [Metarhizium anisopliae]